MNLIPFTKGQVITVPGIYSGVPMMTYHGPGLCDGPSISSSGLRKIFNDSPAHYWVTSPYNPNRIDEDDKQAFIFGRAAHHTLLGEASFKNHFAVRPEKWDSWRTNDAKAWKAEQILAGLTVLEPKEIEAIKGIAYSLGQHPLVTEGILNGLIECTLVWKDPETGYWLKARPDAIPTDSGDFADLKTTTAVDDDSLEKTVGEYGYAMQGALVAMGARAVMGMEMNSFNLVFVEKKPPHCVRVVALRPADIERGIQQVEASLRAFAQSMKTMKWPGPGGSQIDAAYISPKPWALRKIDERLQELAREAA